MITELRVRDFRSYRNNSFEFSPGVNIIVGPNASGKTNLLEAVLVLARGRSYRARDSELIRFGRPWARLDADLVDGGQRVVKLVAAPKPDKVFELSGQAYKRLTLERSLPVVLFEPDHLRLLTGGPERRRDYLDDLLEQTIAGYRGLRRQYLRALAQRNTLLKHPGSATPTRLFPWNVRLSELAGQIVRARGELVLQLDANTNKSYKDLSHSKTKIRLAYQATWPAENYQSHLLRRLEADLELDQQRGFTGSGPHREDLLVLLNGHPATAAASRGETRTIVLALKITELQLLHTARASAPPLLLLDDVFSELDGARRHALTDYLAPFQTFITTTDADLVLQHFAKKCNVIPLG